MPENNEYKREILKYLREILNCETNLIEYFNIIKQKREAIEKLCIPNRPVKPTQHIPKPPKQIVHTTQNYDNKITKYLTRILSLLSIVLAGIWTINGLPIKYGRFNPISELLVFVPINFIVSGAIAILSSMGIVAGIDAIVNFSKNRKNKRQNSVLYNYLMTHYKKQGKVAKEKYNAEVQEWNKQVSQDNQRLAAENRLKIFYESQIGEIHKLINSTQKTLATLYDTNILTPKHRNLVAVAAIYEYLSNGLTHSLERDGYDPGAYNMFRDDERDSKKIAATLMSAKYISDSIGNASKQISNAVGLASNQITDAIYQMDSSMHYQYQNIHNAISEGNDINSSINKQLDRISDNQKANFLIQQEIAKQARLQTEVESHGLYKKLYNQDGYRIK